MNELATLKRRQQLVTITSTQLKATGYIRALDSENVLLICINATGHPDGWLWLAPDTVNGVDSETPELALRSAFIDLNRKHHPAFDPLQLKAPAKNLNAWLQLAVKTQNLIELGLAHQQQLVSLSPKQHALVANEVTIETLDQPRTHVLEPEQIHWLRSGTEYLSLLNQVRQSFTN
ncbi:hypothetical protein [Lacticaseibacillus brantae]|uniref:Uncharacterized protein n=1 Tax=Lacticaseibacillus brantae DSM 23927 TaxID=1423727 RepID=A0A0R2AXB8_9LACO|nr:hypothetical protein [Lacticaseibacillus brantae]KRM71338.1 hypothetical protein FC34_GL001818 [Lacticaseibacillus brantae DSM 23927]